LTLRPFYDDDRAGLIKAILADPAVVITLVGDSSTPEKQQARAGKWIGRWGGMWQEYGYGVWAVCLRPEIGSAPGELIGFCGFDEPWPDDLPELVYALARPYWGQGLVTEAVQACLEFLFSKTSAPGCEAVIAAQYNPASAHIATKLGLTYDRAIGFAEYFEDETLLQDTFNYTVHCLRVAPPDQQQDILKTAAFRAGQLVAAGACDQAGAEVQLYQAAITCGLVGDDHEIQIQAEIRAALEVGIDDPKMAVYTLKRNVTRP
jgi:RimJ/RimL family protein N-acetyltransferase